MVVSGMLCFVSPSAYSIHWYYATCACLNRLVLVVIEYLSYKVTELLGY